MFRIPYSFKHNSIGISVNSYIDEVYKMRELSKVSNDNRTAIVKGDGGSYTLELYKDNALVEIVEFKEHTLKIVERQANKIGRAHV